MPNDRLDQSQGTAPPDRPVGGDPAHGPIGRASDRAATRSTTLRDVFEEASRVTYDRLLPRAVDRPDPAEGWLAVDRLLAEPSAARPLIDQVGRRFGSDDDTLVLAQVAREATSILTAAAVHTWSRQRRLPDLSAANVLLREDGEGLVAGLRRTTLAVLPDDPLRGRPGVEVLDETAMLHRLTDVALGHPVPLGEAPAGQAGRVAAVAAVIATVRRLVTAGDRHLWGSAALAVASTLTDCSHTTPSQAEADLATLFAARPDLAGTVELITVDDDAGTPLTFPLRRTCCLLYKLRDGVKCGTCSLRDHDTCAEGLAAWYMAQRQLASTES